MLINGVEYYGFIYIVTNNVNNKKYIGKRYYGKNGTWKYYLGSGTIINKAIKKYGRKNFSREIIENCETKEKLSEREKYWISYYNAVESPNYYNITDGGDGGNYYYTYTEEQKKAFSEKVIKHTKGIINIGENNPMAKKVICLNNMKIFNTVKEASKYANLKSSSGIARCCRHKKGCLTAGRDPITNEKLQWEWYEENQIYKFDEQKTEENIKKNFSEKLHRDKYKNKKVICYQTEEIFDNIYMASEKYKLKPNTIKSTCNFKHQWCGKLNGEKLQWFWYNYYISDKFNINNHKISSKRIYHKNYYEVDMFTMDDKYIKTFKNQYDDNDFCCGHKESGAYFIINCCRGKMPSYKGYVWKFHDNNKTVKEHYIKIKR